MQTVIVSEAKHLCIPALRANAEVLRFAQDDNSRNIQLDAAVGSYFPAGTYSAGIFCLFTISFNAARSFDIRSRYCASNGWAALSKSSKTSYCCLVGAASADSTLNSSECRRSSISTG